MLACAAPPPEPASDVAKRVSSHHATFPFSFFIALSWQICRAHVAPSYKHAAGRSLRHGTRRRRVSCPAAAPVRVPFPSLLVADPGPSPLPTCHQLVSNAMKFLTSVAEREQNRALFSSPDTLRAICQQVRPTGGRRACPDGSKLELIVHSLPPPPSLARRWSPPTCSSVRQTKRFSKMIPKSLSAATLKALVRKPRAVVLILLRVSFFAPPFIPRLAFPCLIPHTLFQTLKRVGERPTTLFEACASASRPKSRASFPNTSRSCLRYGCLGGQKEIFPRRAFTDPVGKINYSLITGVQRRPQEELEEQRRRHLHGHLACAFAASARSLPPSCSPGAPAVAPHIAPLDPLDQSQGPKNADGGAGHHIDQPDD